MIAGSSTPLSGNKRRRKKEEAGQEPPEDRLDQDLADTFPASDPPAQISKGTISNPKPHEKGPGKIGGGSLGS